MVSLAPCNLLLFLDVMTPNRLDFFFWRGQFSITSQINNNIFKLLKKIK